MTAKPLPDHVASTDEWKAWPRKAEAHIQWGLRERQVTALCRSGKVDAWLCPDGTTRIEPEKLTELFGPPGAVSGRERDRPATEQRSMRAATEREWERDPQSAMMRECVLMLRSAWEANERLVKLVTDPMSALLASFKDRDAAAQSRVATLEQGWLDVMDLRSELADAKHERDLSLQAAAARDARRREVLDMVKPVLPDLVRNLSGGSLQAFAAQVPPELLSSLLESRVLPSNLEEQLKRLVQKKSTTVDTNHTTNGVSHGSSA